MSTKTFIKVFYVLIRYTPGFLCRYLPKRYDALVLWWRRKKLAAKHKFRTTKLWKIWKKDMINWDKKFFATRYYKGACMFLTLRRRLQKQRKGLTKLELVSSIVSSKNNRSYFYSPLQSLIPLFISGAVFILPVIVV